MEEKLKIAVAGGIWPTENYRNALASLGALPVSADETSDPQEFDGLLLPGGYDVHPSRYGQELAGSEDIDEGMDAMQFAVLERFVRVPKPVFGICRGHQLINIFFGGDLIQHISTAQMHSRAGGAQDKVHETRAEAGSWIAGLYGSCFPTNSAHHQAVGRVADDLRAVQYSADGIVEAMHHKSLPVWCVQWHPERMCFAHRRPDTVDGSIVLQFFLEECRKRRG